MVAPIIVRKADPETMMGWFVARNLHWFLSLIAVGLMVFGSYKSYKIAQKNKLDNQVQILNEIDRNSNLNDK
jgi:hypothetical protein